MGAKLLVFLPLLKRIRLGPHPYDLPVEAGGSRHAQLQPISPTIPQVCLVSTAPLYLKQIEEPSSSHSTQRLFAPTRQKNPPTPQEKVGFSREGAPSLEASGRCSPDRGRARERLLKAISNSS